MEGNFGGQGSSHDNGRIGVLEWYHCQCQCFSAIFLHSLVPTTPHTSSRAHLLWPGVFQDYGVGPRSRFTLWCVRVSPHPFLPYISAFSLSSLLSPCRLALCRVRLLILSNSFPVPAPFVYIMDQSILTLPFAGVSGYTIHKLTTDLTSLMGLLVDPAGNILIADVDGKA